MSTATVPHSTNGAKPHPAARVVPLLGASVDRLADLRATLKTLQDEERSLTREIIAALEAQGLRALQGARAVAVLDVRTTLKPDPELFLKGAGAAGFAAVAVSVTAARRFLGADDLAAISETTTTPVLRVEALEGERR